VADLIASGPFVDEYTDQGGLRIEMTKRFDGHVTVRIYDINNPAPAFNVKVSIAPHRWERILKALSEER
jgi:hypothetical protein